jgi:hypothetical protein
MKVVGGLREAADVDGDDPHGRGDPAGQVQDHHALGLEGGDQREPAAEGPDRPGHDLLGRPPLQPGGDRLDVQARRRGRHRGPPPPSR